MSIFSIFNLNRKKENSGSKQDFSVIFEDIQRKDYLGKAAVAGRDAEAAVKSNKYDEAWRLYHEQKSLFVQHAQHCNFNKSQTLALDSTVSEDLANILRLEGRHEQAFVHILYWVVACSENPIKRHEQKLSSYFNRCKYSNTSIDDVRKFIEDCKSNPDFATIQGKVSEWSSCG